MDEPTDARSKGIKRISTHKVSFTKIVSKEIPVVARGFFAVDHSGEVQPETSSADVQAKLKG